MVIFCPRSGATELPEEMARSGGRRGGLAALQKDGADLSERVADIPCEQGLAWNRPFRGAGVLPARPLKGSWPTGASTRADAGRPIAPKGISFPFFSRRTNKFNGA